MLACASVLSLGLIARLTLSSETATRMTPSRVPVASMNDAENSAWQFSEAASLKE